MSMIKYFEKTPTTIPMFEDIGIDIDHEGNADYASPEFSCSVAGVWRAFLVPFQAVSFRYDAEHVAVGCDLPPGVDAGREAAW
eukprot:3292479-Rhodomonas_salina.1